jgi:hypothetical protein
VFKYDGPLPPKRKKKTILEKHIAAKKTAAKEAPKAASKEAPKTTPKRVKK